MHPCRSRVEHAALPAFSTERERAGVDARGLRQASELIPLIPKLPPANSSRDPRDNLSAVLVSPEAYAFSVSAVMLCHM